ncbi:heterokaryon incompatibility protein-domain-containing protein [Annulohypoxylon maeteangense]|uniref:heterokaryon incompatibility protein-domain-containing protein n=1 Tax=Annulohypoxylon maeteangense TaxID=1927788 RepID=UPI0020089D94|nr:heterokaryon incompatibility protein-domain-containing protein [Annulohypoxylon maeteangense]KAI0886489.1 heterokaryon incompatibility protein-domain-containing protein [Annulohypoxylon maeteangense]
MGYLSKPVLHQKLQRPDSIRLLELHPGKGQDPLVCIMHHVSSISTAPAYECISYVWGDPNETEEILCGVANNPSFTNGNAPSEPGSTSLVSFSITKSLAGVLRRLRLPDAERIVWADGICINQEDLQEKGLQVALMGKIYGRASSVAVWLGHSDNHTKAAIELIDVISNRCREFVHPEGIDLAEWRRKLNRSAHFLDYLPERGDDKASINHDPRIDSLDRFFGRAWFCRVWVIQEVATCDAITAYCGTFHLPWDLIALAAGWCLYGPMSYDMQKRFRNVNGISNALFLRDKVWQTADTVTFLHLIGRGKDFDATNARDKIYAMLSYPTDGLPGGSDPRFHFELEPDYTKATSEVYSLVAIKSIQCRRDLEILSYVDHGPELSDMSPTWIPRWDRPCTVGMLDQLSQHFDAALVKEPNYSACVRIPLYSDGRSLTLSGFRCGIVHLVTESINHLDLALDAEKAANNPLMGSFRPSPERSSGSKLASEETDDVVVLNLNDYTQYNAESICTAYARTLSLARTIGQEISQPSAEQIAQHTADFASYVLTMMDLINQNAVPLSDSTGASSSAPKFLRFIQDTTIRETLSALARERTGDASRFCYTLGYGCLQRKFFRTVAGHIGIGPAAMAEGDILVMFRGGRMIYTLRERDEGWSLIGECYVHGFMNGELGRRAVSDDEAFRLF